jgi:hypothetical protein
MGDQPLRSALGNDLDGKIGNCQASERDQMLSLLIFIAQTKIDKLPDLFIFENPSHEIRKSDFA